MRRMRRLPASPRARSSIWPTGAPNDHGAVSSTCWARWGQIGSRVRCVGCRRQAMSQCRRLCRAGRCGSQRAARWELSTRGHQRDQDRDQPRDFSGAAVVMPGDTDSPLEQSGFEPLVPLEKDRLSAALVSRPDQRQLRKATVGLIVRIRFAPAKSPRRTAPAVGAGTPLRKGGTDGSNPVPSSGESGQLQLRDWQP